jgi:hypothetical protein
VLAVAAEVVMAALQVLVVEMVAEEQVHSLMVPLELQTLVVVVAVALVTQVQLEQQVVQA